MPDSCPACNQIVQKKASSCDACGYGFSLLSDYYQGKKLPEKSDLLTDHTDTFNSAEALKLRKTLQKFQRDCPPFFFALYLESEGEKANTKGLWIHNVVDFSGGTSGVAPQYGLLFYLDPEQGSCSISYGLGVSPYLSLQEVHEIVEGSTVEFSQKNYFYGVNKMVRATATLINKKCIP